MPAVIRRLTFALLLAASLGAWGEFRVGGGGISGPPVPPPPQTIASVLLNGTCCTGSVPIGSPSGTVVGNLSATMSPATPGFSGTFALSSVGACSGSSSAQNGSFQVVGTSLQANGGTILASNAVCVAATQASATNSPFYQAFTITGTSSGGALTYAYDNATNSSGQPADTVTLPAGFTFPYTTMQGVPSEPERFVAWNANTSSQTSLSVSYSGGSNPSDFSTAETNCTGTLPGKASFTGSISGTTLTVSSVTGTVAIGQQLNGLGIAPGTVITAGSGASWTVNNSQTVSSEAMTALAFCRVIVNFTPSTTGTETGNLVVSYAGGSSSLPLTGNGKTANVVAATCATLGGNPSTNPTLAANTLYLLGDVTCPNAQFHTSNGTAIQGDCTAYDGAKTVFDGTSTLGLFTNGIGDGSGGDGTNNVWIACIKVINYGKSAGACTAAGANFGHPQFNSWNGWILTNDTFGPSCGTGTGMWSTSTLRNSHITGNLYNGGAYGINGANSAAGTMLIAGDSYDHDSGPGITLCARSDIGECAGFKAVNYGGANGHVQDLTVSGGYFNETNLPQTPEVGNAVSGVAGVWCDGCRDVHFTVTGATFFGDTAEGVRCEITVDQSTTHTQGDFQHNVFLNNNTAGSQGQLMGVGCFRMTVKNNFIDSTAGLQQADVFNGPDGRENGQVLNADFENNIVVMRVNCPGFSAGVCYGMGSLGGSETPGTTVIKNETLYVASPYNTGSSIFIGPDNAGAIRNFAQMQTAGWFGGTSSISGTLPSGAPSGCTGDGKYPAGCVGSGM